MFLLLLPKKKLNRSVFSWLLNVHNYFLEKKNQNLFIPSFLRFFLDFVLKNHLEYMQKKNATISYTYPFFNIFLFSAISCD